MPPSQLVHSSQFTFWIDYVRRIVHSIAWCLLASLTLSGSAWASDCPKSIDATPSVQGWGIDVRNHRYISDAKAGIDADNLDALKIKWVFALPDTDAPRFLPLITPDTVVVTDESGIVYALSRTEGCEKWRFDAGSQVRTGFSIVSAVKLSANPSASPASATSRGDLLIFGTFAAETIAINVHSGEEVWRNKVGRHPRAMISGTPVISQGVIYQPISSWEIAWALNPFSQCCTFRGPIVALDAATGKELWRTFTIEQDPSVFEERMILPDRYGPSGAPVWSQPTVDEARGLLYVGTGENYSSPATDTSDAIIAFDLKTGAMKWKQQFLANDAWNTACELPFGGVNCPDERGVDLDFGAPPILATVKGRDYLLAGQKSGWVFALDPNNNGALLWKVKAGNGGKAGGIHFAMAADEKAGVLYVPISDRDVGMFGANPEGEPQPSIQAFDIASGAQRWATAASGDCLGLDDQGNKTEPLEKCFVGFSAAPTATDSLLIAPSLDGVVRVFDQHSGAERWRYNTVRDFDSVNGQAAKGGTIDLGGVFVEGGDMFIVSGYGQVGQMPGNAFIVLSVN